MGTLHFDDLSACLSKRCALYYIDGILDIMQFHLRKAFSEIRNG